MELLVMLVAAGYFIRRYFTHQDVNPRPSAETLRSYDRPGAKDPAVSAQKSELLSGLLRKAGVAYESAQKSEMLSGLLRKAGTAYESAKIPKQPIRPIRETKTVADIRVVPINWAKWVKFGLGVPVALFMIAMLAMVALIAVVGAAMGGVGAGGGGGGGGGYNCVGDCYDMDGDGRTTSDYDADGDGYYESP